MTSLYQVYVNGLLQYPQDYTLGKFGGSDALYFSQAPSAGSEIVISDSMCRTYWTADGTTIVFPCYNDSSTGDPISNTLVRAFELRHIPAVAEALERLQVVVELSDEARHS